MAIPKNKAYMIGRLLDLDQSLSTDDLERKKVVELLQMIEDYKKITVEKIEEEPSFIEMAGGSRYI